MNEKFLIANTTREQREAYVKESLGYSDVGCEGCGASYGYDLYEDYIDGKKELAEITMSFRTSYISEDLGPERGECGYR